MAKMYEHILVPLDGSDAANRAARHALDVAEQYGATLHTLVVVDTDRYGEAGLSSTEIVLDELEAEAEELLERLASRADNRGVETTTRVRRGTPYQSILDHAEEVDADLIVIGYQGLSHALEGHLGSTTDRVIRVGDRPVLVV